MVLEGTHILSKGYPLLTNESLSLHGTRYSAIAAMTVKGVQDVVLAEGTMDGERFVDYIESSILPILQPFNGINHNSIVVMDNASIHHVPEVVDLIHQKGAIG